LRFASSPVAIRQRAQLFSRRLGRQPAPDAPWVLGPWFQPGGTLAQMTSRVQKLRDAGALSVVQTYALSAVRRPSAGARARQLTSAMHAAAAITTYFNP
jgi:hypothetical protein